MNILTTKEKLERLDQLIRLKATGTPKELSAQFNITERTVFRIINQLKKMGFPIYFNKEKQSYCYEQEGKLTFKFESKAPDKEVIKLNKNGGGND